jgi:DNA-binding NtrC family response regulator
MTRQPLLLVVDDERSILRLIARFAETLGFAVQTHPDGHDALDFLSHTPADAAIVDLQMPGIGGLEVLRAVRDAHPDCQVILMTGHASVDTAIEAVKLGARDYLGKPLDLERLKDLLISIRDDLQRRAALLKAESETAHRLELCGMIGRSVVMQELFGLVRRIAPHARVALITGETGAGKEGVAAAIHKLGPRSQKKFLTMNCSAVVETLFESELFGHVKGAFTGATDNKPGLFEAADGGTLFLDEVGELAPTVQAKLLRVIETGEVSRVGSLQSRKVDVRIVAATNRDLQQEADSGRFRADLYYRLNVVELKVPPLRDRLDDLPYLTASFVREFSKRFHKPIEGIAPAAERTLQQGHWAGNVRQLRNVLERACMLAEGVVLTERDLAGVMSGVRAVPAHSPYGVSGSRSMADDVESIERLHIDRVLQEVHGNKTAAAQRLGLSRRTLYRKLAELRERETQRRDAASGPLPVADGAVASSG